MRTVHLQMNLSSAKDFHFSMILLRYSSCSSRKTAVHTRCMMQMDEISEVRNNPGLERTCEERTNASFLSFSCIPFDPSVIHVLSAVREKEMESILEIPARSAMSEKLLPSVENPGQWWRTSAPNFDFILCFFPTASTHASHRTFYLARISWKQHGAQEIIARHPSITSVLAR